MRGVLRVLLTLTLAVTCLGYFVAEKRVTLADDGRVRTVTTFAPTVGAALQRLGVELGPDDVVYPPPDDVLSGHIEVRRAKDVVVILNGSRRSERVTGKTVAEVLEELSLPMQGAYLQPGPGVSVDPGDEIVVNQPVATSVEHDGVIQPIVTNVLTAGALLRQMGIVLGPADRVEPSIIAHPKDGPIKVIRVSETLDEVRSAVPYRTIVRKTDALESGVRKVEQKGQEGVRLKVYRLTYEDGQVVSRTLVSNQVVQEPKEEIVLVGTRKPAWSPGGSSQTGKASWYRAPGMTAAHRSLPFGTVVRVTDVSTGKWVDVTIRDRGPYIDGRIIDLSDEAFAALAPLGTGVINVRIQW